MPATRISPTHWKELVKQIHAGNCVPFLGAGVNVSSSDYKGLPLAKGVTAKLIEDLTGLKVQDLNDLGKIKANPVFKKLLKEYDDLGRMRAHDLGRVAFHVCAKRKHRSFIELLKEILPDRERKPSKLLMTLARLPVPLIVTTNYDRLMEKALSEAPLLRPSPPRDPVELTRKLTKVDDPLSEYFRERLSADLVQLLGTYKSAESPPLAIQQAVMSEMTRLLDDIKDPVGLARKLRSAEDPVSAYLHGRLSPPTRQLIDAYQDPVPPSNSLMTALIDDLNEILRQDSILHAQEAFSLIDLPTWARKLMRQEPEGDALLRLNRLLLGKAYPREIAEIHVNPVEVVVQPIEGFVGPAQTTLKEKLAAHDGVVLYKIHGSFLDQEPPDGFPSVVITEEDYIQFLTLIGRKDGSIPPLIEDKLVSCNLLFLGYGLEDWDFRTLYKGLISSVPRNKQRESFAIQYNPPEYWVRFWEPNIFIYDMDIYEFADELEQRCRAYHEVVQG
jgi:hypothetical protein